MINFKDFLSEGKLKGFGDIDNDSKGKLHELLVGYHLRGGKHMEQHPDQEGLSPKEKHDQIVERLGGINSQEYKRFSERARKSAEDIKNRLGITNVKNVQWTSKAGDIKRATGIDASQKEDPSDIVITGDHADGRKDIHSGVSLKLTDANTPTTLSNLGLSTTYGGEEIQAKHKKSILTDYPELAKMSVEKRKEYMKSNPSMAADIKQRNKKALDDIVAHLHSKLQQMTPQEKSDHIRKVLGANPTPMENQGHNHIRHTTYGGENPGFEGINPATYYEHTLNDPENITTKANGTVITFMHHGVPFATHSLKYQSMSDPLGSIQTNGKDVKPKKTTKKTTPSALSPSVSTQSKTQPTPIVQPTKKVQPNLKMQQPQNSEDLGRWADDGGPSGEHGGAQFNSPADTQHAQNMQMTGAQ